MGAGRGVCGGVVDRSGGRFTNRSQFEVPGFVHEVHIAFVFVGHPDDLVGVDEDGCILAAVHLVLDDAFGLQAAELIDAAVEEGVGGGPGAFDGADGLLFGFVEHGVAFGVVGELGFDGGTAAEAPGGSGDFGGEGFFEETFGVELGEEGFAEVFVEVALVGFDVVLTGVEAEDKGVAGGGGFAGFGAGSGREVCVEAIGFELGFGWHLRLVLSGLRLACGKRAGGTGWLQVVEKAGKKDGISMSFPHGVRVDRADDCEDSVVRGEVVETEGDSRLKSFVAANFTPRRRDANKSVERVCRVRTYCCRGRSL